MAEAGDIKVKVKLETESGESFDVQRLRLEPGDIIVLKTARQVTFDKAKAIKEGIEAVFTGHECLVLCELDLLVAERANFGPDS
jgi:hypothetical protein